MSDQVEIPEHPVLQNKTATRPEWLIGYALGKMKLDFYFQFTPYGLIGVRGTPVIDFLVLTKPNSTPLEYDGLYWHTGALSSDEYFQRALIADYFKIPEVPAIDSNEVDDKTPLQEVIRVIRKKLRL